MSTATDPQTGIIHDLADRDSRAPLQVRTLCGKDARGWSTAVTLPQTLGLALFCEDCKPWYDDGDTPLWARCER
jgi:hypothetical protein